jgi:hypothetical protein
MRLAGPTTLAMLCPFASSRHAARWSPVKLIACTFFIQTLPIEPHNEEK